MLFSILSVIVFAIGVFIIPNNPEASIDEIMNEPDKEPDSIGAEIIYQGEIFGTTRDTTYILKEIRGNSITIIKQKNNQNIDLKYEIYRNETINFDNGFAKVLVIDYGQDWIKVKLA